MRCSARLALGYLLCLCATSALAHDLGVARLILKEESATVLTLRAKLSTAVLLVPPQLPENCAVEEHVARTISRVTQLLEWRIRCEPAPAGTIRLHWQREGAMLLLRPAVGEERSFFLPASDGDIDLELGALFGQARTPIEAGLAYVSLGIEHILVGLDHLAFVLALCLIASGWRLVTLITGFTLGHSLTLLLASLGHLSLPAAPVEACIALSIVYVAREAMLAAGERRHGFWLVAGFGLLHGLGFSGALAETGVGGSDLVWSLVGFNLGVELGQLLFVAMVLSLAWMLGRLEWKRAWQTPILASGLGALAVFWTLERVAALAV